MTQKRLAAIHPGEVLDEEFLKPLELSQYRSNRLQSCVEPADVALEELP